MTQEMGLSSSAFGFLQANCTTRLEHECPSCQHKFGNELLAFNGSGLYTSGMFHESIELKEYILKDGRSAVEEVQCVPWSSGPCIFLQLRVGDEVYSWTEEKINAMI